MCIRPSFIAKMKKFHNEKDILESNLSVPIKRVLHQHLLEICNTYGIDDILAFGSICYIESSTDLETLDLSVIEWSISIEIITDNEKQQLFYFCILIDNDTGLNILVDEKYLKKGAMITELKKLITRKEQYDFTQK